MSGQSGQSGQSSGSFASAGPGHNPQYQQARPSQGYPTQGQQGSPVPYAQTPAYPQAQQSGQPAMSGQQGAPPQGQVSYTQPQPAQGDMGQGQQIAPGPYDQGPGLPQDQQSRTKRVVTGIVLIIAVIGWTLAVVGAASGCWYNLVFKLYYGKSLELCRGLFETKILGLVEYPIKYESTRAFIISGIVVSGAGVCLLVAHLMTNTRKNVFAIVAAATFVLGGVCMILAIVFTEVDCDHKKVKGNAKSAGPNENFVAAKYVAGYSYLLAVVAGIIELATGAMSGVMVLLK